MSFCQLLVASGLFKIIDHKFPKPGHSFLDSDRDFGRVEKLIRKHQNIYDVNTYHEILVGSSKKTHVTRMGNAQVDIKSLPKKLGLVQSKTNTSGELIKFRDSVRWIRIDKFGHYKYRTSHSEREEWKYVELQ